MNKQYIQLSQVLDQMDALDENNVPRSFQMKFVTADRSRRSGGEIIDIPSGKKCVGFRNGILVFDTRESSGVEKQAVIPTTGPILPGIYCSQTIRFVRFTSV